MSQPELYALNSADWHYEWSSMLRTRNPGESYPSLTPFYLIDHPDGTVLIDTGTSYEMLEDPADYGAYGAPYIEDFAADEIEMDESGQAGNVVDNVGYDPAEIDIVVMTHLHLDHAGGIDDFPDAEFIVQQDELEYAWWPADPIQHNLYVEGDFGPLHGPEYDVTAIDGDYDVFGDGVIECIFAPGHTAGHQIIKIELEEAGTILIGADLAFIQEAYEEELQPPFAWDTEEAIRSNRMVRNLERKTDANLILAHDREHYEALPTPPETIS